MVTRKPKHILIAPLDWGLGHTTRSIPIIRHILRLGHIPVIAGNPAQRSFIEETFGPIDFIHHDGYNITYSRWNKWAQMGLLSQLPHIHRSITAEHHWLQQLTAARHIDGIISDNRYGLHHPTIPSVIITHQLVVRSGFGRSVDNTIRKIHNKYLNRFNATWVADAPGTPNLGGDLSHAPSLAPHTHYIGLLSRFEDHTTTSTITNTHAPLMILLSGPEPQRTALAALLWQQATHYAGNVIFIEGSDQVQQPAAIPPHITYHARLTQQQLQPLLLSSGIVICRSGYSTLMDLAALNKKAIIIPTPGQTEQEYLARYLHAKGIFYTAPQKGFDLNKALTAATRFPWHPTGLQHHFHTYQPILADWIASL